MILHIRVNRGVSLAQDNKPRHTTRRARQLLQDNLIVFPHWSAESPDLYTIELLWDILKRRIRRYQPPNNVAELERLATVEWGNIRAIQ